MDNYFSSGKPRRLGRIQLYSEAKSKMSNNELHALFGSVVPLRIDQGITASNGTFTEYVLGGPMFDLVLSKKIPLYEVRFCGEVGSLKITVKFMRLPTL